MRPSLLSVVLTPAIMLPAGCGGGAPPPPEKPPPAPVQAVHARTASLDAWAAFPGATQPLPGNFARVTAAVEGRVLAVFPEGQGPSSSEGQWIKKGQVVLRLDESVARANLAKAAAARKELRPQTQQAANAVRLAQSRLERIQKLKGSKITGTNLPLVSAAETQQAQVALRDAEAQLQAARAKENSGAAAVGALREQLRLYTVRAPLSGWLSLLRVAPGQTISPGTPIADIVDLSRIDVLCYVPPSRIGLIAVGEPARIETTDTHSSAATASVEGRIFFVGVQGQPDTGSFAVKARFANQGLRLKANTLVRLGIRTARPKQRLVIPEAALLEAQEPPEALVVTRLHRQNQEKIGVVYHFRAVLGVRNRQRHLVEILGLESPGQEQAVPPVARALFVVAGGPGLHDGDEVRVTAPSPAGTDHD